MPASGRITLCADVHLNRRPATVCPIPLWLFHAQCPGSVMREGYGLGRSRWLRHSAPLLIVPGFLAAPVVAARLPTLAHAFPCAFCHGTRSLQALTQGDLQLALRENTLVCLSCMGVAVFLLSFAAASVSGKLPEIISSVLSQCRAGVPILLALWSFLFAYQWTINVLRGN